MAQPDTLELKFGEGRWLQTGHGAVTLLAFASILFTPSHTAWKIVALSLLVLVHAVSAAPAKQRANRGVLRLWRDGSARIQASDGRETGAQCSPRGWSSQWFSVLVVKEHDSKRTRRCVVCASENVPDDYRRLRVWMRLSRPVKDPQGNAR
jgi:hypothetical protein